MYPNDQSSMPKYTVNAENAQENKTPQDGNSHAADMSEYRKRIRLEKAICNKVYK
jgi:hypothetical protein